MEREDTTTGVVTRAPAQGSHVYTRSPRCAVTSRLRLLLPLLLLPLLHVAILAQGSLSIFDIDASAFPVVSASFLARDAAGNRISPITASDVAITEGGIPRRIVSVQCNPTPVDSYSVAISIDISSSTRKPLPSGRVPAHLYKREAWSLIHGVPLPPYEFSLIAYPDHPVKKIDHTSDLGALEGFLNALPNGEGNEYEGMLFDPEHGLLTVAARGRHKRIAILLTDTNAYSFIPIPAPYLQRAIDFCQRFDITFYAISHTVGSGTYPLQALVDATGGRHFKNVSSEAAADAATQRILEDIIPRDPGCRITWVSEVGCPLWRDAVLSIPPHSLSTAFSYQIPRSSAPGLTATPPGMVLSVAGVDRTIDKQVTLRANEQAVTITSITPSNPAFEIIGLPPLPYRIERGATLTFTVRYRGTEEPSYGWIDIVSDACPIEPITLVGENTAAGNAIRVVAPNGGERFLVGDTTVLRWDGVSAADPVELSYSTNAGTNWNRIGMGLRGLEHTWIVPNTPSETCLLRAVQQPQPNGAETPYSLESISITSASISRDGLYAAVATEDSLVHVLDGRTGSLIRKLRHEGIVFAVSISADSRTVVSSGYDGRIYIWDLASGALRRTIGLEGTFTTSLTLSSDGGRIIASTDDQRLTVWSVATGEILARRAFANHIWATSINNDGSLIAMAVSWQGLVLIDGFTLADVRTIAPDGADFVQFGGPLLLARVLSGLVVYDAATGKVVTTIPAAAHQARISPDGSVVATTTSMYMQLWDARTGESLGDYRESGNTIHGNDFSDDGQWHITGGNDGRGTIRFIGRPSSSSDVSDSLWAIEAPLDARIGLPSNVICQGMCIVPTNTSVGTSNKWEWTFEGAVPETLDRFMPGYVCYPIVGEYRIILIASSPSQVDTAIAYVRVIPPQKPATVTRCGTVLEASEFSNYQWNRDGVPIDGATSRQYAVTAPGSYTVTIIGEGGCAGTSDPIVIDDLRGIPLEIGAGDIIGRPGDTLSLPVHVAFGDGARGSYTLTAELSFLESVFLPLDRSGTSDGTTRTITVTIAASESRDTTVYIPGMILLGTDSATAVTIGTLRVDHECDVDAIAGMGEIRVADFCGISSRLLEFILPTVLKPIHPNPVGRSVTLEYTVGIAGPVTFDVVDMRGAVVHSVSASVGAGEHTIDIDLAEVASGHYWCVLRSAGGVAVEGMRVR
jgi:WD40 repeat protein